MGSKQRWSTLAAPSGSCACNCEVGVGKRERIGAQTKLVGLSALKLNSLNWARWIERIRLSA